MRRKSFFSFYHREMAKPPMWASFGPERPDRVTNHLLHNNLHPLPANQKIPQAGSAETGNELLPHPVTVRLDASQKGFGGARKPQQIKSTHLLLIQLKDSRVPSGPGFRAEHAARSERPRSPSYALPRGLHFHLPKLPAYLLFSDGRLGTVHFLKPPALGQDTHALPGALPAHRAEAELENLARWSRSEGSPAAAAASTDTDPALRARQAAPSMDKNSMEELQRQSKRGSTTVHPREEIAIKNLRPFQGLNGHEMSQQLISCTRKECRVQYQQHCQCV